MAIFWKSLTGVSLSSAENGTQSIGLTLWDFGPPSNSIPTDLSWVYLKRSNCEPSNFFFSRITFLRHFALDLELISSIIGSSSSYGLMKAAMSPWSEPSWSSWNSSPLSSTAVVSSYFWAVLESIWLPSWSAPSFSASAGSFSSASSFFSWSSSGIGSIGASSLSSEGETSSEPLK